MGRLTRLAMKYNLKLLAKELKKIQSLETESGELTDEVRNQIDDILRKSIDGLQGKLDRIQGDTTSKPYDFSDVRSNSIFTETLDLVLVPMSDKYKDDYIRLEKQIIQMVPPDTTEEYWEKIWNDTKSESEFDVAIIRKSDAAFLGYVGIKNTRNEQWELAIELLNEYTGKGYGSTAIRAYVDKIYELTGRDEFLGRVEPDNHHCQRMMKKIGAKLEAISDYCFNNDEDAAQFEEENLDEIDEEMIVLANELQIEPRKMLSHVLDYRIYAHR